MSTQHEGGSQDDGSEGARQDLENAILAEMGESGMEVDEKSAASEKKEEEKKSEA